MRYNADIAAGALKVAESRIIADLLLREVKGEAWHRAIVKENVLRTRSPATAARLSLLIRHRLDLMSRGLWLLVRDGSSMVSAQANLAAAIKHSALLGDFMDLVLREQYRLFRTSLAPNLWDHFIAGCQERDPDMPHWHESTIRRMRSSVFQMLAQSGFIDNTRQRLLKRVHIAGEVLTYLEKHKERYVLRCIQVGS